MKKNKKIYDYIPAKELFHDDERIKRNEDIYVWLGWGLIIKHLRQFMDIDQEIFGRLLSGYTRMQISRYEKEQAEPPIDFWIKMVKMFGLSISWVFTGEGIPYIEEFKDSEERLRFCKWSCLISDKQDFINELKGDYNL